MRHVAGHIEEGMITLHDGSIAKINKKADEHLKLIIKKDGAKYKVGSVITEVKGLKHAYYEAYLFW